MFQLLTPAAANCEFTLPKKSKKELDLKDVITRKFPFFM